VGSDEGIALIKAVLNDQWPFIAVINAVIDPNFKALAMQCFLKLMNILFILMTIADEDMSQLDRRDTRVL